MSNDFTYGIFIGALLALAAVCLAGAAACGGIGIYKHVMSASNIARAAEQQLSAPVAAQPQDADRKENF